MRVLLLTLLPWCILFAVYQWKPALAVAIVLCGILAYLLFPVVLTPWLPKHGQCPTPPEHKVPFAGVDPDSLDSMYYPGLGAGWMQGLRYTGGKSMTLESDTTMPNAPFFLYNLASINPPEYNDLAFWSNLPRVLAYCYMLPITTMARVWQHIVKGRDYVLAWPLISFAGRNDIQQCLAGIREYSQRSDVERSLAKKKPRQWVLAGSSRGASTMLGAVVNMTAIQQERIAFVLLEGAFDSVPNIGAARYGQWLGSVLLPWLLSWVTQYDPNFPTPLELAKRFPHAVPVLFVTSKADWHVPWTHTRRMYEAVKENGHPNVTLLILEHSHHSFFATDQLDDQTAYRHALESMYSNHVAQRSQ